MSSMQAGLYRAGLQLIMNVCVRLFTSRATVLTDAFRPLGLQPIYRVCCSGTGINVSSCYVCIDLHRVFGQPSQAPTLYTFSY